MNTNSKVQEYRQDLLSGEWVIMSANRTARPNHFKVTRPQATTNISEMVNPFLPIVTEQDTPEEIPMVVRDGRGQGVVYTVINKFPMVHMEYPSKSLAEGPYTGHSAYGSHELFVYRDPELPVRDFSLKKMEHVFEAFQKRSLELMHSDGLNHIFIFHNHGEGGGASITHPHSQLIASPIIPDGIERMLTGAAQYYKSHKRSLFAVMVNYEQEHKKRIIFENDDMIALCPYASRSAFEVEIIPKEHKPHFPFIVPSVRKSLAEAYKHVLQAYFRTLGDIDYNMYLYTAPCDGKPYEYFRWFIRISPKLSRLGGYETGADTDVCTVFPEQAAETLRTN